MAATVAILAMPVAALLIYAGLGSPGLPDQPFAERGNGGAGTAAGDAAMTRMQEALAKLRTHLKSHPDDLTGWALPGGPRVRNREYNESAAPQSPAPRVASRRPP